MTAPITRRYIEDGALAIETGQSQFSDIERKFATVLKPGTVIWVKEHPYHCTPENESWMKHHNRDGWNWRWLVWAVSAAGVRVCRPFRDDIEHGHFMTIPIEDLWSDRIGRLYNIGWWLTRSYAVVGEIEPRKDPLSSIFALEAPGYPVEAMPYGYPNDLVGYWYHTSSGDQVNIVERDWLSKQGWYVKNQNDQRRWFIRTNTLAFKLEAGELYPPVKDQS